MRSCCAWPGVTHHFRIADATATLPSNSGLVNFEFEWGGAGGEVGVGLGLWPSIALRAHIALGSEAGCTPEPWGCSAPSPANS